MDAQGRSPTAVRRHLGVRLRDLRLQAELTVAQAAEAIDVSPSKITKIEKAQLAARKTDVQALLALYGVADPGQHEQLLTMVREGKSREWWESYDDLPPRFGSYLGLETIASTLHAYENHVVHGLLQTPDYARASLRAVYPERYIEEINQLVEVRMRRHEVLTNRDPQSPLTLWVLMDEGVLRRPVGGPEVMRAQLEHLIAQSERPNVNVLVLPNTLGAHAGLTGPFAMLQFEAGDRPVIYVECQAGNLYLEKEPDIRRGQQTLNHLMAAAPSPTTSVAIVEQVVKEMQ